MTPNDIKTHNKLMTTYITEKHRTTFQQCLSLL